MKIQPTDWNKIFSNNVTNKGLISEMTNSSCNSISQKQPDLNTWAEDRCFPKEDTRVVNRQMKMYSSNHQGNVNQNHNEIISHIIKKTRITSKVILVRTWRKENTHALLVRM